jgi:hypothetical protein
MSILTLDIGRSLLTVRTTAAGVKISIGDESYESSPPIRNVQLDEEQSETLCQFLNEYQRLTSKTPHEVKAIQISQLNALLTEAKYVNEELRDYWKASEEEAERLRTALNQFVACCDTAPPTSLMNELGMACKVARKALEK